LGISIVRFQQAGQGSQWGIVEQGEIAVLTSAYASHRELMNAWFSDPGKFTSEGLTRISVKEANLLAPVTRDIQIFCQGLNYASHQEEGGIKAGKGENLIFSKPPSTICGPYDDIIRCRYTGGHRKPAGLCRRVHPDK
jgi:2-keto-4-pentenoate hydratase/2-oxohepta-3-ene-1,7-dioic acid hydratase in catechol pathway